MGVNRGILPPKWMVKIMENPIKMDDLGVPLFSETPIFLTVNYMKGKVTSTVISPEKNGHPHIKTFESLQNKRRLCTSSPFHG